MGRKGGFWDNIERLRKGLLREMMAWRYRRPELRDNVTFKDPEAEREYQRLYGDQ